MSDKDIETQIIAKGLTAPRVTPQHIESVIISEHYFTAASGVVGEAALLKAGLDYSEVPATLKLLTFCVLVLRNGFTVTGESACASPENFDAEIGRKIARENAVNKIWMLEGYRLKQQLSEAKPSLETTLPPHQLRLLEELAHLTEKSQKLNDFISDGNPTFMALPPDEQKLLNEQAYHMEEYLQVLIARVKKFQKK